MQDEATEGSTNSVDQLLRSTSGPTERVREEARRRLQYASAMVLLNYTRINSAGENIENDGYVHSETLGEPGGGSDEVLRARIYRLVHNYVSSVYSFTEQTRNLLNEHYDEGAVSKRTFLPRPDSPEAESAPPFVQKIVFIWGLRNQMVHGEFRCLYVEKQSNENGETLYALRFDESAFEPHGTGGLENAGDYLRFSTRRERRYPLCYLADFQRNGFNEFREDLAEWCRRRT